VSNLTLADKFQNGHKLAEKEPSIVTELELKVLEAYLMKSVKVIAKELEISEQTIYSVFQRIRERRQRFQHGVNFWNDLAKDKRLRIVLTPRREPENQEEKKEEEGANND
jgi:predicted DNA-binding protein YlxM (UPF0122 family)